MVLINNVVARAALFANGQHPFRFSSPVGRSITQEIGRMTSLTVVVVVVVAAADAFVHSGRSGEIFVCLAPVTEIEIECRNHLGFNNNNKLIAIPRRDDDDEDEVVAEKVGVHILHAVKRSRRFPPGIDVIKRDILHH